MCLQLRQHEFYFITVSSLVYLSLSSLLRARRADLRSEETPIWVILSHCLMMSGSTLSPGSPPLTLLSCFAAVFRLRAVDNQH